MFSSEVSHLNHLIQDNLFIILDGNFAPKEVQKASSEDLFCLEFATNTERRKSSLSIILSGRL